MINIKTKKYSEGNYFSVSLRQNRPPLLSLTSIKKILYYSGKFLSKLKRDLDFIVIIISFQQYKDTAYSESGQKIDHYNGMQ